MVGSGSDRGRTGRRRVPLSVEEEARTCVEAWGGGEVGGLELWFEKDCSWGLRTAGV